MQKFLTASIAREYSEAMDRHIELRWKGSSAPRAKQIPKEKWEEHKAELFLQYRSKTLEELMSDMGKGHNFWPS